MKLCMAAPYDIQNPRSWSGTPLSLYQALSSTHSVDTLNLSVYHTNAAKRRNMLLNIDIPRSLRQRKAVSKLGLSQMNPINSDILHRHCSKEDYDALIEFGGFLPDRRLPPYYIYTDASHDLSLSFYETYGLLPFYFSSDALDDIRRSAEFARPIYQNAAGVFCMSQWLADAMISKTGVPKERVHVVYAGANWHGVTLPPVSPRVLPSDGALHLLLTGVSYLGKGVDLACDAVKLLNKEGRREYILHVCGIKEDFPHDEHVINHHFVDKQTLISLLQQCHCFVLPSRFDCFGIAFVEAMTFGLPCVGRQLCAMPEIIDAGINGELIDKDDPVQLADKISSICGDDDRYARYSAAAIEKAKLFTWDAVAKRINTVLLNK